MNTDFLHNRFDILESILHGILVTDLRGHIIYWNRVCVDVLGYREEEIIGKSIRMLYDDDNALPFKEVLSRCITGEIITGRWYARHKDGSPIWLDIRLKVVSDEEKNQKFTVVSVCNIEKLKTTERELKEKKAIAAAILDTSVDAIITINEKGKILSFNRAAKKMFGYDEDEVFGRNVKMLMPLPFSENHDLYLKNYLETGEKKIIGKGREAQGLRKNRTVFPIDLSVSEVRWEGNRIFTGIIKDQTARRELERRMQEIGNEERRRIGRDLHDGLGQMLTGIRMVSENLARKLKVNGVPGAAEVQEISDMIKNADEYARTLSRGMVQVDLEKKGLGAALQNLCRQTEKLSGINCTYMETGNVDVENHSMALHIYRIVQESINNVIKHADARNMHVRLSGNVHHLSVTVDDDGRGFETGTGQNDGTGIQIMKYRAGIMGGVLEIVRKSENLTRVRCIVPQNRDYFN